MHDTLQTQSRLPTRTTTHGRCQAAVYCATSHGQDFQLLQIASISTAKHAQRTPRCKGDEQLTIKQGHTFNAGRVCVPARMTTDRMGQAGGPGHPGVRP